APATRVRSRLFADHTRARAHVRTRAGLRRRRVRSRRSRRGRGVGYPGRMLRWLLLLVAGCAASAPPDVPAGHNPLVADDPLTPFPSSLVEADDSSTATGVRLAIPDGVLPVPQTGPPLSASRLNGRDGVSPSTPFLVYFKAGVDASQLPAIEQSTG